METLSVTSQALRQEPPRLNPRLLDGSEPRKFEVVVDLRRQRVFLLSSGEIALETPACTGSFRRRTPVGVFQISEKVESGKTSTISGGILPFWMRFDDTSVGMHIGPLPGHADSLGCIRLPEEAARIIFAHAKPGTEVRVVRSCPRVKRSDIF